MYAMFASEPVLKPRSTRTVSCARSDSPPGGDEQMTEVPEIHVVCPHLVGPMYATGLYTCRQRFGRAVLTCPDRNPVG